MKPDHKKILVFTATRAEYGLFRPVIREAGKYFDIQLLVGGSHLSPEEGNTIREILADKPDNVRLLPFLLSSRLPQALTVSVGNGLIQMAQVLQEFEPDFLMVLGDRYEIFIPIIPALLHNIPIIHIHGGEKTLGAIDEQIRHAVTKMSHIHFVASMQYADNVSRMGEEDWRIFVIGAPGLDNIRKRKSCSLTAIRKDMGVDLSKPTVLCTYHPVTLEGVSDIHYQINNLISALLEFDVQVIFTRPNAEVGSDIILRKIAGAVKAQPDSCFLFDSLGTRLYHSIMGLCRAVVGNSSSGILEAPFLKVPTVNIGTRQTGRIMASSVIQCGYAKREIKKALDQALHDFEFRKKINNMTCPFGDGKAGVYAASSLREICSVSKEKILKKNLDFSSHPESWHTFWS
ncbi:UDP-N-acetylglucosamine 2-epimerase (hydrolyzing) [Candidatus Sumerlaeota bacterium]|nr:UDP-N-acetylglucosamine 2-epimerase (hydrolyzing) [Candidatus Sumerlaeota bacterium]